MISIDGGPAFPVPGYDDPNGNLTYPEPGMSLRDWFAGQALTMIDRSRYDDEAAIASVVYAQADAMLAARKQSK